MSCKTLFSYNAIYFLPILGNLCTNFPPAHGSPNDYCIWAANASSGANSNYDQP